jgi:hypothetical protein
MLFRLELAQQFAQLNVRVWDLPDLWEEPLVYRAATTISQKRPILPTSVTECRAINSVY